MIGTSLKKRGSFQRPAAPTDFRFVQLFGLVLLLTRFLNCGSAECQAQVEIVPRVSLAETQQSSDSGQTKEQISDDASDERQQTQPAETPSPEEDPSTQSPMLTLEAVAEQLATVEGDAELSDEARATATDALGQAQIEVNAAIQRRRSTKKNSDLIRSAPQRAAELRATLESPVEAGRKVLSDDSTLEELQAALAAFQPQVLEAKTKLDAIDTEIATRAKRRKEIVEAQATFNTRLDDLEGELSIAPPSEEPEAVTRAHRTFLTARLQLLSAEPAADQAELALYDAEKAVDVLALKSQAGKRTLTDLQSEVARLNQLVAARRREDTRYVATQLRSFAQGNATPGPYRFPGDRLLFEGRLTSQDDLDFASATAELAESNADLTELLANAIRNVAESRNALEALQKDQKRVEETIERVGETGAIGLQLRKRLNSLRNTRSLEQQCAERRDEMSDLEFTRIDLEDQIREFQESIGSPELADPRTAGKQRELRLVFDRLATVRASEKNHTEYFNRLGELDAIEQELVREVERFRSFIRTRVLWIRSNRLPSRRDVQEAADSFSTLVSPQSWRSTAQSLSTDLQANVGLYTLLTSLLVLLMAVQSRFRRTLNSIGDEVIRRSCRDFAPTARAAVLTAVIAFPWPFLIAFFGWRLYNSTPAGSLDAAAGRGLLVAASWFLILNLLRQICRPKGLALAHFGWSDVTIPKLRSRLYGLILLMLPVIYIVTALHHSEYQSGRDALERLAFSAGLLILARFLSRVMNPQQGIFRDFIATHPDGWVRKTQWVWYGIFVSAPLVFVLLTILGYYYTAFELCWRLHVGTWMLMGLLICRGFFVRWFVVNHRRLRMDQAMQRLRAQATAAAENAGEFPQAANAVARVEDETQELDEISDQTRRFIDSGLVIAAVLLFGVVWADVVRALDVLDEVPLWSTMMDVTVNVNTPGEPTRTRTEPQLQPVTVSDVLIAALFALVTYTAARNVPGMIQMALLQKLPLHPASRYAIRMVTRYIIVVLGVILTFARIGVGWSKVQWLAAALTVGLGFGLQEIFANFVSGLIILFERPVRIGDVVTIGDVTGTVSRIQIRATTITDWDRKEYIVPNREFVTGRLLNWTLSDQTNRIVLNVGVAYGTDTTVARSLLLQAATDHPLILKDPGPVATFESFGDSTLDLVLRCYLPDLDNRLAAVTELHESVDRLFQQANIEISFPQQDVNIRTLPKNMSL